jgi:hypothetical protein
MARLSLTQQFCDELNTTISKICGDSVDLICSRSLPSSTEEYVLSGIMYKTIETANALLQRDKVDFTLDLKVVDPLVFEQYPELRDVVRTACQTGEFGSIVDLGESLLTC